MDRDENLILLTLDLDIPNLWENDLVRNFPKSTFTIKHAYPLSDDSFSGLLQIDNPNIKEMNKFLEENHPFVSLDSFHNRLNLFHYLAPDKLIPKIVRNSRCFLNWPVNFMEKYKRLKFILKDGEINSVIEPIEKENIPIQKFSKVKINFNLNEILTPKQKEILAPSLKYGYYEFPKKINLNELSRKIGVSPSTLCVHLQKIESKIFNSNYQELFL